jgi:sodium-dependent phosphate cotransporter
MNISAKEIFPEMEEKIEQNKSFTFKRVILFIFILYLFFFSLEMMGLSVKLFESNILKSTLANPFIALVIGLLLTAIFQSSSTTTSLLVALVASNSLAIVEAIPVVIGANIGTTITAIITSLAHISYKKEFKKAVSGAFIHHNFKLFTGVIIFLLEYFFHFLSTCSIYLTHFIKSSSNDQEISSFYIYKYTIEPFILYLNQHLLFHPVVFFVISFILLFVSIRLFIALLKNTLIDSSHQNLDKYVFDGSFKSFSWGMFVTALLHSSTATTSFMVPLIATNKVSLKKAYPFIIGANIGTTFTAIVAALSKSPDAMSIALAHFLFNFIGMIIFFIIPVTNNIPLTFAKKIGRFVHAHTYTLIIYVVVLFFLLPFLMIAISR